jgi:hypothetical protein
MAAVSFFLSLFLVLSAAAVWSQLVPGPQLKINFCTPKNSLYQQWEFATDGTSELRLLSNGLCVTVLNYSTQNEAEVYTDICHPSDKIPSHQNQVFTMFPDGSVNYDY